MNTTTSTQSILIVEDSDEDFIVTQKALQAIDACIELRRCVDGDDILDCLYQRGSYTNKTQTLPSLILLDLNLPGTDGREVLAKVKSDPTLKNLPIVVLTTSNNPSDVIYCYEHGANSFIQKPIGFEDYKITLQTLSDYWFSISQLPPAEAFSSAV